MIRLLDRVCASPWDLDAVYAERLLEVVVRHDAGVKLDDAQIRSAIGRAPKAPHPRERAYEVHQGVAIVPIQGLIHKHAAQVQDVSGPSGSSYEHILGDVRTAIADPEVRSVLLHIESPGGLSDGSGATSRAIAELGRQKPIWSLIDGLGASAAYAQAIGAARVYATPSSQVGSIGTMIAMRDTSAAAEKAGVKTRVVRSAPLKGGAAAGEPITDAHLADAQRIVDGLSAQFYQLVAERRGLADAALAAVTDGRVHLADEAFRLGLIDGVAVGALEQVLAMMTDPTQFAAKPKLAARASITHPGNPTMKIAPQKLIELQKANPAHSTLIGDLAVGAADREPATEREILDAVAAAAKDAAHASVVAKLADAEAALAKATEALAAKDAAHAEALKAKDAELAKVQSDLADALKLAGTKGVKPLDGAAPADAKPVDAIAAYNAKVDELKKAGDKTPDRTIAAKFPELRSAFVAAHNQTQKGATK